jgi:hypothetical protein
MLLRRLLPPMAFLDIVRATYDSPCSRLALNPTCGKRTA